MLRYLERRAALPCEDAAVDDPQFQALVADIIDVSARWPYDWSLSAGIFFGALAKNGCAYLSPEWTELTFGEDYLYPPYIFSINICSGGGSYYPVHPMAYFCPVACGCRSGDAHCPDACPARPPAGTDGATCPDHQRQSNGGICPMAQGAAIA